MEFPKDLKYTKEHEWVRADGNQLTVGITGFAVEQLGDITLVELPEAGTEFAAGDTFGTVESVKSVSDLYAPISGKVAKINEALEDAPELVNDGPYGDGWLVVIEGESGQLDGLLDVEAYSALVAEEG